MTNQPTPKEFWPIIHAIIYCPHHTGKTTFAATFPKPMLVMMYDAPGKDQPFLKVGHHISGLHNNDNGTPFRHVFDENNNVLVQLE